VSTWEPIENLSNCLETVVAYFEAKVYPELKNVLYSSKAETLKAELSKVKKDEWNEMIRLYFIKGGHVIPEVDKENTDYLIKCLSRLPSSARDPKLVKEVRRSLMHIKLRKEREHQLKLLNHWKDEINSISPKSPPITVYNVIDLDGPPSKLLQC